MQHDEAISSIAASETLSEKMQVHHTDVAKTALNAGAGHPYTPPTDTQNKYTPAEMERRADAQSTKLKEVLHPMVHINLWLDNGYIPNRQHVHGYFHSFASRTKIFWSEVPESGLLTTGFTQIQYIHIEYVVSGLHRTFELLEDYPYIRKVEPEAFPAELKHFGV